MSKKKEAILLGLIFSTAFFLRFFNLCEAAPFLGDQGRDLIEVRELLSAGKIPLTGPLTNFGVHAGAFYYYLIAPFLILGKFHPLEPMISVTSLGVITSLLIYLFGRELFGSTASFLAAMFYASSPTVISRTQGIWNPIPIPFFTLLILFSLLQIQVKKRFNWLAWLGLFLGLATQFYLPALLLTIPVAGWWFYFFSKRLQKKNRRLFLSRSLAGLAFLLLTYLPFFLFELQNQFHDTRNFLLLLFEKMPGIGQPTTASSYPSLFFGFFGQQFKALFAHSPTFLGFLIGLVLISLPFFFKRKGSTFWHSFLSLWLGGGILILTFSFNTVYPHHASFLWPLPFLILASFLAFVLKKIPPKIVLSLGAGLILFNFASCLSAPASNYDLRQTEALVKTIAEASKEPFFLNLVSGRSPSDAHLRYFLELEGTKIARSNEVAENLVLVCQDSNCDSFEKIKDQTFLSSECLPVCPPLEEKREINLKNWQLKFSQEVSGQMIYFLEKANSPKLPPEPENPK